MNEQAASLAALNVALLTAIDAGPASGASELAERAGIIANNVARKLKSLEEAGLVEKTGEGACDVQLTADGALAIRTLAPVLLGQTPPPSPDAGDVQWILFSQIDAWDGNPRTWFDPEGIEELARSIAEEGVLQPITVRPKGDRFEVIMGERRRRAAVMAVERQLIPDDAFCVPCIVRQYTDDAALDVAGVENLQRDDLHWMDEARYYRKLAERGRTAAQIATIAGGRRSKRHVQTYTQVARGLSPEDIARTYLPETHKDRLLYVQARDLVGEKREKPPLELNAKLACALLEAIEAGITSVPLHDNMPKLGSVVVTRFYKAYVGGPFATLEHDRKLMTGGFHAFTPGGQREPCGRFQITEDVIRWLKHLGYHEGPENALRKARAAVVGDMIAAQMYRDGRNLAPELNAPDPPKLTGKQRRKLVEIAHKTLATHGADGLADFAPEGSITLVGEGVGGSDNDLDLVALTAQGYVEIDEDMAGRPTAIVTVQGRSYLEAEGLMPDGTPTCRALRRAYAEGDAAHAVDNLATFGTYQTTWLNLDADYHAAADDDGAEEDDGPFIAADDAEDAEPAISDKLLRLAGVAAPAPAAPVSPAPVLQPPAPALPPYLALVILELAHKIASPAGVERGKDEWGAPVLADYYKDQSRLGVLIQQHGLLKIVAVGHLTVATLPQKARDWLGSEHDVPFEDGRPVFNDNRLQNKQLLIGGAAPQGDNTYITPWLNPPEPEAAAEPATDPAPPSEAPKTLPVVGAQQRALVACDSLLGQLDLLLGRLRGNASAAQKGEVDQFRNLIGNTREAAKPHLPENADA